MANQTIVFTTSRGRKGSILPNLTQTGVSLGSKLKEKYLAKSKNLRVQFQMEADENGNIERKFFKLKFFVNPDEENPPKNTYKVQKTGLIPCSAFYMHFFGDPETGVIPDRIVAKFSFQAAKVTSLKNEVEKLYIPANVISD